MSSRTPGTSSHEGSSDDKQSLPRRCAGQTREGNPCAAFPVTDSRFCFTHAPERAPERARARKLGGERRRRAKAVAAHQGEVVLESVSAIQAVLVIAVTDTLALENSVARSRTLGYLAGISLRAWEIGQLEERVRALEKTLNSRSG
jgi:hypothetical protein